MLAETVYTLAGIQALCKGASGPQAGRWIVRSRSNRPLIDRFILTLRADGSIHLAVSMDRIVWITGGPGNCWTGQGDVA